MYLKSLDIHGFKSFANKTEFEFHQGVTGIVGPNGCGKSNVVDAIRWVLGETSAKALRGGEMADVIFNGTDKHKPLGMAEVILTMGDCEEALKVEYNEVSITRRVFRDGKSEYRINGTLCRLRDIHDLFMDTGIGRTAYSIMEQGKIDMLLSSKPEDRRQVFEEAAGITKFKKEKKDALRKLGYTETNLLRVNDVLAEQERRMNSLKRQVAKARRFQSLSLNLKILDTHLGHKRYTELRAQCEELKRSIHSLDARELEIEQDLPEKQKAVVAARERAEQLESQLSELRQTLNEKRNAASAAQNKIAFNNERLTELVGRIEQNEIDIKETLLKLSQQEKDLQAAIVALAGMTKKIESQVAHLSKQEEQLSVSKTQRQKLEKQLSTIRSEANQNQTKIATAQAKIESALAQFEGNRERASQLGAEKEKLELEREDAALALQKLSKQLKERVSNLTDLAEQLESQERAFQRSRGDLDSTRELAAAEHKQLAKTSSRLEVLQQLVKSGEGLGQGTQAVLSGLDDEAHFQPGIRGVLANFIQVESKYTQAVEASLGAHLQAVLVRDSKLAESIIETLTTKQMGQAAMVPEDFIPVKSELQMQTLPTGSIAWAVEKVSADPSVNPVIEKLLQNVLVVKDLAAALELRPSMQDVTFTTLNGVVVSADGMIRGGEKSDDTGSSVLDRHNEVRELESLTAELTTKEKATKLKLESQEILMAECREAVEIARERLQKARVDESKLQGQLSLANREVESIEAKISNLEWERNELKQREKNALGNREQMEAELAKSQARYQDLEQEQLLITDQLEEMMVREQEMAAVVNEHKTQLAVERRALQSAEEQKQPMAARLEELRQLSDRRENENLNFRQRITHSTEEIQQLQLEIESNTAAAKLLDQELEKAATSRASLLESISIAEKEANEIRQQVTKIMDQKGKEEVSSTKFELRMENLLETMQERYQVNLKLFLPSPQELHSCLAEQGKTETLGNDSNTTADPVADSTDWEQVESILVNIKRKLESMGPVNVDAIQEFEELEERFNFVKGQYDDLTNSKDELIGVIERINVETRKRFSETFDQIRTNFREMFKLLFGEKGEANLQLVDESDPLESGIDVIAKPPGKKLQSITLFSGGERSMTAVALLFSIYQIKPSPFCVLDELDAPLDESNIGRFLKVLDRFIDTSQFIIVTHSKRTMSRADVMYGITMQDSGVSKPVSMRLTKEKEVDTGVKKSAAQKAALSLDAE